jgi:hypothetical protein
MRWYTIVSTRIRHVVILYDIGASPKKRHSEGTSEAGTIPKGCIDINNDATRRLRAKIKPQEAH